MGVFLGVDIGTTGTKTLAIDEAGKILAEAKQEYPCYEPELQWSEQDPEDWWQATKATIKAVIGRANLKAADVKAIGLSGQMHGSVFLRADGTVIRRALLWNDQRTKDECDEITERAGGRKKLLKMVANPALTGFTAPKILWLRNKEPENFEQLAKVLLPKDDVRRRLTGEMATDVSDASGMLLLDVEKRAWSKKLLKMVANPALTGFTAPKILWLRNKEPENFEQLAKVLLPKDDVRRRLTGEMATDVSDASGMLLLDVEKRAWSKKLLKKLDLDESLLATVYESEQVTGKLRQEVADELGLSTDCLVVGGAGDCAANAVGTGVVTKGVLSTSVGSSGVMFVHSDKMQVDPNGRLHTFCHAVNGKWHMMGVNLSAGRSLQWLVEDVCTDLPEKPDPYEVLSAEAAGVPTGSQGLFFLPYLSGERTPHADPLARGCFIGLTLSHKRGHLSRSVMEGVTYSMRDSLEIIRELKVPVKEIRASGGGSKNPLWRQMQADVFNQEVATINAEEGPAYGVALLAAVGAGAYSTIEEACEATIHVVSTTPRNKEAAKIYSRGFPLYQRLYKRLRKEFPEMAKF